MAAGGVRRSASSTTVQQIQRKISGSLVGLQQQQQELYQKRKWLVRLGLTTLVILVIVYLGIYLQALHAAIHHQKTIKQDKISVHNTLLRKQQHPNPTDDIKKEQNIRKQLQQVTANNNEMVLITTSVGTIRIILRSDLSKESVEYVKQVVQNNACNRCNLYRVEKPGILQGIINSKQIPITEVKGACPSDEASKVANNCPEWDKECNCHGPVMTYGMVGWAAGQTGPDFFINTYKRPAKWWGTQHTVWGEIQDNESFNVINHIFNDLPSHKQGDLTYLDTPLHFDMTIEYK